MRQRAAHALRKGSVGRDSLWGSSIEGLTVVSQLVTFTLLGRSLGPATYGAYIALFAILGPFTILAGNGVIFSMHYELVHEPEKFQATTRSYLTLIAVLGSLLAIVGAWAAHVIVPELPMYVTTPVYLTELVFSPVFFGACAIINIKASYAPSVRARAVPLVLRLVLIVGLAVSGTLTIKSLAFGGFVISVSLAYGMTRFIVRRFGVVYLPGRSRFAHIRSTLNFSVGGTALALQNDGDKTFLAANSMTEINGLYSAAYKIVQLGLVPLNTLLGATHQRFLTYRDEGPGMLVRKSMLFSSITAAYGLVFILLMWIAAPLLPVLLGDDFAGSTKMLVWLSPLVMLRGLSTFPLNGLLGLHKTGTRTVLTCCTAALSIAVYATLIPRYTWKGAVAGTFAGEIAMALGAWVLLIVHQRRHDRSLVDDASHLGDTAVGV